MPDATFTAPDLTTFARLDGLGLVAVGQRVLPGRSEILCTVAGDDSWCHECGCQGVIRDSVQRRLAHTPLGWCPVTLVVRVRRYRCPDCKRVWRQDTSLAAEPRAKLSRAGLAWGLEGLVVCR